MPQYKSPINGQPLPQGRKFTAGEVAREAGRKGALKSKEKRQKLKTLREQLEILLADERQDSNGKKMSVQAAMTAALVKEAISGNTRAYQIIRDTLGQKPVEHMEVAMPDYTALDAVVYGTDKED